MNTSAVSAVTLHDFLENDLNLGRPIEVETLSSIFDGAKKPLHYSGLRGTLKASINAVDREQWRKFQYQEEPGTVLFDVFKNPVPRIEAFIKRQLAKQGMVAVENLDRTSAGNIRIFADSVRRFIDHYAQLNPKKTPLEVCSMFVLRRDGDEPNWNIVLRLAMFEKEGDSAYVQMDIPRVVHGHARLIFIEQADAITNSLRDFLNSFGELGEVFKPLLYNDMAKVIMHMVAHQPEITAEQVYSVYRDMVGANSEVYQTVAEKDQLTQIVPWESLPNIRRQILSSSVEVARLKTNMYLAYNRLQALAEQ